MKREQIGEAVGGGGDRKEREREMGQMREWVAYYCYFQQAKGRTGPRR